MVHFNAGDLGGLPVYGDANFSITGLWEQSKSQKRRVKSHLCAGVAQKATLSAVCRDEAGHDQQIREAAAGAVFELCSP